MKVFSVRLTQTEIDAAAGGAKSQGVTVSEWIRLAIKEKLAGEAAEPPSGAVSEPLVQSTSSAPVTAWRLDCHTVAIEGPVGLVYPSITSSALPFWRWDSATRVWRIPSQAAFDVLAELEAMTDRLSGAGDELASSRGDVLPRNQRSRQACTP
jgi:hypothetical protein